MPSETPAATARRRGPNPAFWAGKRVLLTGHTGFMGAWTALWLDRLGVSTTGWALPPRQQPNLYVMAGVAAALASQFVDLRDRELVTMLMEPSEFDIVLHLAPDPLPGAASTLGLLEALLETPNLKTVVVATAAAEPDREAIIADYATAHCKETGLAIATACTAGLVGGGDYAADRPTRDKTRPARHVLDGVAELLIYAQALVTDPEMPKTLDKAASSLDARPLLNAREAITWTREWREAVLAGASPQRVTLSQIDAYVSRA